MLRPWYEYRPFQLYGFRGLLHFRTWLFAVKVKDTRKVPMLFSERNRLGRDRRLRLGRFLVTFFLPWGPA
jgi:hypothetical protein